MIDPRLHFPQKATSPVLIRDPSQRKVNFPLFCDRQRQVQICYAISKEPPGQFPNLPWRLGPWGRRTPSFPACRDFPLAMPSRLSAWGRPTPLTRSQGAGAARSTNSLTPPCSHAHASTEVCTHPQVQVEAASDICCAGFPHLLLVRSPDVARLDILIHLLTGCLWMLAMLPPGSAPPAFQPSVAEVRDQPSSSLTSTTRITPPAGSPRRQATS